MILILIRRRIIYVTYYISKVYNMMYAMICTFISYSVNIITHYLNNLSKTYFHIIK